MSSVYFSPTDLNLIKKLLTEACQRAPDWDYEDEAAAAKQLLNWMQDGIHDEETLRERLRPLGTRSTDESSALPEWDAEGGAPPAGAPRHGQYGRRIEADGTWTIYEVFTGREARQRGLRPSGLTKEEALDRLVRFSADGIGASSDELNADRRPIYSFWRRAI